MKNSITFLIWLDLFNYSKMLTTTTTRTTIFVRKADLKGVFTANYIYPNSRLKQSNSSFSKPTELLYCPIRHRLALVSS